MAATLDTLRWANAHLHFFNHLSIMPSWHKVVLLLAGFVAIAGTVGRAMSKPAVDPAVQTSPAQPAGNSLAENKPPVQEVEDKITSLTGLSPHMQGVGLSLVGGFVIGWFFRAFLKTMLLFTLLIGGTIWLLSHYNIMHLSDQSLQTMKEKTSEAASWLSAQARHWKDVAVAHLPSSTGGAFGAFLGMRRR